MNVKHVHAVRKCADDDATVAVMWAGVFPYFSGLQCVDLMGKCDKYIAGLAADSDIKRAGHNKHDIRYSIDTYHPDIVLHMFSGEVDRRLILNYTPVMIEVDGYQMAFCMAGHSSKVRGGTEISWHRFSNYHGTIKLENRQFQAGRR